MKNSRVLLLLLGLILLAFGLRMLRLDFFSLRGDESFTVLFVQKPLAQMWRETLTVEPNPPLMYFLLRGWIALAGDGEFATRFFSAFFGVGCVALVYGLARALTPSPSPTGRGQAVGLLAQNDAAARADEIPLIGRGQAVGLLAAFIVAINPYQIWHSQDVRNYTLWPALSLLALVFFWRWYNDARRDAETPRIFRLVWFGLAELAALYAHYYEAFILLALNLFVLATLWRDLRKLAAWVGAQIILAALYLPYPLILSNRVAAYGEGSGRQGVALWDVARETFSAFVLSDTLNAEWRTWVWLPFAFVALCGLIFLFGRDWKRGLFFALYAGVPTLAVFALNTFRPLYLERYLNGIAPAYYLLGAYGIAGLPDVARRAFPFRHLRSPVARRWFQVSRIILLAALACVAFLALQNYWTNPAYAKAPDWRGLAKIINAHAQPGDIIVQNFPETSLLYYDRSQLPLVVYPETFLPDLKTAQQLNALNANYQRVWFIPAAPDFWDPEQYVEQWLTRRGDLLTQWTAGEMRLGLYATASQYLNTMQRADMTYGDTLTLLGFRAERLQAQTRIVLYWRAKETPKANYVVRVQVADLEAKVLGQAESVPARGTYPTTQWRKNQIVVDPHEVNAPADAPVFRVRVCETETQTCLPITDPPTKAGRSYFRLHLSP